MEEEKITKAEKFRREYRKRDGYKRLIATLRAVEDRYMIPKPEHMAVFRHIQDVDLLAMDRKDLLTLTAILMREVEEKQREYEIAMGRAGRALSAMDMTGCGQQSAASGCGSRHSWRARCTPMSRPLAWGCTWLSKKRRTLWRSG